MSDYEHPLSIAERERLRVIQIRLMLATSPRIVSEAAPPDAEKLHYIEEVKNSAIDDELFLIQCLQSVIESSASYLDHVSELAQKINDLVITPSQARDLLERDEE